MTDVTPRQKMCSDLLITAIEGGTGYWAAVTAYNHSDEANVTASIYVEEHLDTDEHLIRHINWETMDRGIKLVVKQAAEDDTPVNAYLTRQIKVLDACDGEEPYYEACSPDAETSDVILQVALFGEVVYG